MGELDDVELTVVVPCYNAADTMREQLDALVSEAWEGVWEILVVDNGSTDETCDIAHSYDDRDVPVRVISATDGQSVAYARNAGIRAARATSVAICDGDDVVQPGWVGAMGAALRNHRLVGGVVDSSLVNDAWLARTRPVGTPGQLPRFGNGAFVSGGNCGMRKRLWEDLGGYDEAFRGLEDIEFSLRSRAVGVEPMLAPGAVIGYRYREGIRPLWRQGFFYGRGRRELTRRAKAMGLQGASPISALKSWLWLVVHLPKLVTRSGRYAWLWVLANRIGALRGVFDHRGPTSPMAGAPRSTAGVEDPRYHGVLITYRRPEDLGRSLDVLAAQSRRLDTLLVVDNDADEEVAKQVRAATASAGSVCYLATAENMGPTGGIHAGVGDVLSRAADDDWIVLLDDDDPPQRDDCLEELQRCLGDVRERDPRCTGIGLWGARLNTVTGRLRTATGTSAESVAYLPGGSCPHYSVATLRVTGAPSPDLFFGFDDLELGLRIRDLGLTLYSSGVARDYGLSAMVEGRRASAKTAPPTWRRYYSLRNLIIVLRSHGNVFGALTMSIVAGVLKPSLNLVRRPRIATANLKLNARALRDGWLRRTGKTIDPA